MPIKLSPGCGCCLGCEIVTYDLTTTAGQSAVSIGSDSGLASSTVSANGIDISTDTWIEIPAISDDAAYIVICEAEPLGATDSCELEIQLREVSTATNPLHFVRSFEDNPSELTTFSNYRQVFIDESLSFQRYWNNKGAYNSTPGESTHNRCLVVVDGSRLWALDGEWDGEAADESRLTQLNGQLILPTGSGDEAAIQVTTEAITNIDYTPGGPIHFRFKNLASGDMRVTKITAVSLDGNDYEEPRAECETQPVICSVTPNLGRLRWTEMDWQFPTRSGTNRILTPAGCGTFGLVPNEFDVTEEPWLSWQNNDETDNMPVISSIRISSFLFGATLFDDGAGGYTIEAGLDLELLSTFWVFGGDAPAPTGKFARTSTDFDEETEVATFSVEWSQSISTLNWSAITFNSANRDSFDASQPTGQLAIALKTLEESTTGTATGSGARRLQTGVDWVSPNPFDPPPNGVKLNFETVDLDSTFADAIEITLRKVAD